MSEMGGGAKIGAFNGENRLLKPAVELSVWQQRNVLQRTIPYAHLETRIGCNPSFDVRASIEYQSGYETKDVTEGRLAPSLYW